MIGEQLGPYTIERELGAGGMGTVYLGVDAEGGRVAVKVVHPHLIATPGFFKRFLREADLGRKVEHDNVVRTLDVDATVLGGQQVNYMIMEYVEGKSLRELLNELKTIPESLLREIALQTAAGLAAIHAADIVHRDLKPENVLITDDHRVRIMDLGVAKLQEASIAITREGQFAGSVLYAAPEQFSDRVVGPPADQYALGVMLYELASGDNPFRRDDAATVIQAHLSYDPPRVVERNTDVSGFLSEVTATLIAKEPQDRFESASFLQTVLTDAEQSEWWAERAPSIARREAEVPNLRVRRDSALHGRDEDLAALRDAWERARGGDGNTLLLEGEAGIGKTRLVDEFLRGLDGDPVHVLYGSYPPQGGLGALSDSIIGKFGATDLGGALKPYLTATPALVPAFAALIKHETLPTGAEPMHGDALHAVCIQLMRALAGDRPTIWVIDDLHFAGKDSRDLVFSLARATHGHRVLLLVTSRPGLPEEDVAHLSRLENVRRRTLARLSPRAILDLLSDTFKSQALAEKLGGKIALKSDGVPFFVFEMVRGLKEGAFLRESEDGSYVQTQMITDIEVPSAIKDLIDGRLKGLSEGQRAILDVGAVQGLTFDPGLVAMVLEEKKVRVLRDIAEIERKYGLVRGEDQFVRFDQNQVQEVLYSGLLPDLRREYHTLLADALLERLDDEEPDGADAHFLAIHYLKGSRVKRAKPYLDPAIERLSGMYRNAPILELYALALKSRKLLTDEERCAMLVQQGSRLGQLGYREEEGAALREAVELAESLGDATLRSSAHWALGWHLGLLAHREDAQRHLEIAYSSAQEAEDEAGVRRCANALGGYYSQYGAFEQAEEFYSRADSPIGVGLAQQYSGRFAAALETLEASLARYRDEGSRTLECIALVNLGRLHAMLGDAERGRAELEQAREIAHAIGQRRPEGYAWHRLGVVAEQAGDPDEAERRYRHALALRRETRYVPGTAKTLVRLGRLLDARELLEEGATLARGAGLADETVLAAAFLGEGAEEAFAEYGGRMRVFEKAEACLALWQSTNKPEWLAEARRLHELLLGNAPEECRAAMLREVPLHVAIGGAEG